MDRRADVMTLALRQAGACALTQLVAAACQSACEATDTKFAGTA